jgi:hypothetical protein
MSARRLLVDRRIADSYLDRLAAKTAGLKVGDPAEAGTVIGPLINQRALDTVAGPVAGGAKVLAGGERVGRCFQATLLADVPADSELARVETFGPVATVEVVDGAEEAVARATTPPTGWPPGSSPATPTGAWPWPTGSRPASSTSTTSRSATSPRCPSAGSRTAALAASAARPWSTSSPS